MQRIESVNKNLDPSEQIGMGSDEWAREEYFPQMPEGIMYRRATNGRPLERSVNRSRQEETLIYRLSANRETSLMETRHSFGTSSSPTCPHCGLEPETAEHYNTSCSKWAEARSKSLGEKVSVDILQQPAKILDYTIHTGFMFPNQ